MRWMDMFNVQYSKNNITYNIIHNLFCTTDIKKVSDPKTINLVMCTFFNVSVFSHLLLPFNRKLIYFMFTKLCSTQTYTFLINKIKNLYILNHSL